MYEHRARLERSLQKEKLDHKNTKSGVFPVIFVLLFSVSYICFYNVHVVTLSLKSQVTNDKKIALNLTQLTRTCS